MSIEGGSGGGVSGGVGGIASLGGGIEGGSAGGFPSIINEGPVRGSLEGFRPMNVSDITTIDKGGTTAPPSVLQQAETVAAAAWEGKVGGEVHQRQHPGEPVPESKEFFPAISRPATLKQPTWEVFLPQAELVAAPTIVEFPKPQIVTSPARVSTIVAPIVLVQPVLQEQEEEKVSERVEKQTPKEVLEEEEVTNKRVIVEDEEVTTQRRFDIRVKAVKKAQELASKLGLKKIPGRLIALFAPAEYAGVRSQIIKEQGPDGSYQEIVEELAGAGEFESETAAQERVDQLIAEKKPAKYGKNGTPLAFEHVARIFKYRIFKPVQAHIEVIKRVVKKKVVIPQQNASFGEKKETNLEELSPALADVFQKTA